VDFSIKKNVMVTERVSAEFGAIFTNVFNHNQLYDPTYSALGDTGDWGALEGQVNNTLDRAWSARTFLTHFRGSHKDRGELTTAKNGDGRFSPLRFFIGA
jgi:hypothetical protein